MVKVRRTGLLFLLGLVVSHSAHALSDEIFEIRPSCEMGLTNSGVSDWRTISLKAAQKAYSESANRLDEGKNAFEPFRNVLALMRQELHTLLPESGTTYRVHIVPFNHPHPTWRRRFQTWASGLSIRTPMRAGFGVDLIRRSHGTLESFDIRADTQDDLKRFLFLLKFVGIGADDSWYFQYRTWPSESEFATYSRLFFPEDSFGRPMLYGSEGRRNKLPLDSYSFPAFEGAQAAIQDLTGLTAQIEKCDVFSGVVMPLCLLRSAGLLTIHPAN